MACAPAPEPLSHSGFPAEPWRLSGELWASAWLAPAARVRFAAPPGWRAVRLGARIAVGAVWAAYRPPGELAYDELAVGVLIRRGLRIAVTIPWIWVDSPASRDGGRALWAIPKRLARFGPDPEAGLSAEDDEGPLASAMARAGLALPGRWPIRLTIVQPRGDEALETPAAARTQIALAALAWRAGPPIGFLDGLRPLASIRLAAAEIRFGRPAEGFR